MKLIRLTAILLLLVMYCAERISPTDSMFDPDNKGGNYGFTYTVGSLIRAQLADSQLQVFVRYPLSCQLEERKDPLLGYRYRFEPVDNQAGARSFVSDTGFSDTLRLYFTGRYDGLFTVVALKPNGDEISLTDSIHVGNPFRIDTATGWMMRQGSAGAAVIGRIGNIPKELDPEAYLVQWLRNGVAADTTGIAQPCTLGLQDSSGVISAVLYEKTAPNVSLTLDSVSIVKRSIGAPRVRLTDLFTDRVRNVQVNEPDTIWVKADFADSIEWVFNGSSRTGTAAYFVHTPSDTAGMDTLMVFAKNRFGIPSDTDTVFIKAGNYAILLKAPQATFPLAIAGRVWHTWNVVAEAADIPADSIRYRWTVSPASAVDSIRDTATPSLQLYCNPNRDVDSFTLKVVAFAGADSSLTIGRQVMVRRYRPVVTLRSSTDSCNLYDTARFTFTVSDNGRVDSVWYRSEFNGDTPRLLKDSTLALLCTVPGERIVKFWCVDDSRYTSDTVRAMVNVRSDSCHFKRNDTTITVYAGAAARITAPEAYPGSAAFSSIVKWMWDLDTNGVFDKETEVNYFDTVFPTPGTSVMRVGCRNNKGSSSIANATVKITVSDGAPVVDSVYGVKSTAFIREMVTLRIKASDGDGTVEKLIVTRDTAADTVALISVTPPAGKVDTMISIVMNNAGSCQFSVIAIDDSGKQSRPAVQIDSMVVGAGRPVAVGVSPDTCWMLQDTLFTVAASDAPGDNDPIRSVSIQWDGGVWQDTASLSLGHTYSSFGKKNIRVVVFDTTGMASDTLLDSIFVKQGRPSATIEIDSASPWIKDTIHCVVHAADTNGTITGRYIRWDNDSSFVRLDDSTEWHVYHKNTVDTISAYAIDSNGLSSDTAKITVNVRLGRPSVGVRGDTIPWVNDSVTMTVSAADENDSIAARYIRWTNSGSFIKVIDSTEGYRYGSAGLDTVSVFSIDNDSIRSDTVRLRVRVRKGAPRITSVVYSRNADSLYINDNIGFRVTVLDSNDRNDKVKVSWVNSTTYTDSATIAAGDTVSFTHQFARDRAGSVSVRFKVTDDDGFSDSTVVTIQVKSGAPTVSLLSIAPAPGDIFVNKPVMVRFRATDGNGLIRKIYVNWQGGGTTPEETLIFSPGAASIDTAFTHVYDTTGGTKNIRLWAVDEDTISSTALDTGVLVRKCSPRVWGDTLDTLWVKVDNGPSIEYPLLLSDNAYDTNGVNNKPVRYYINDGSTFDSNSVSAKKNSDGNFMWLVDEDRIDKNPKRIQFAVLDNDGFLRGGTFWVFADSAPIAPTLGTVSISADSVKFIWQNTDVKDGDSTQFRVLCDVSETPSTVVKDFSTCGKSGSEYYFWYHLPASGRYRFVVVARDRRGTQSTSVVSSYFDFVKP